MTPESRIEAIAKDCCRFLAKAMRENCVEICELVDSAEKGVMTLSHAIEINYATKTLSNKLTWSRKSKVEEDTEIPNPDQPDLIPKEERP